MILICFNEKIYLMNDFKANVFIDMNIMKLKRMKLNFEENFLIIFICQNFKIQIQIKKRNEMINRFVRVVFKVIIFFNTIMFISIRIKNRFISKNKIYVFQFKIQDLNFENKFFIHITNANLVTI